MRTASLCLLLTLFLGGPAAAQGRRVDRAPQVGSLAPDFALHRLDAKGQASKETVKLSELCKTKPVVLVFGSYT
tara:strand:- start:715 stop:936 length:222 start_codon:yes stop_codon:yes gene_type:complete